MRLMMERTMSMEDKIRRAEEIYYRRRGQSISNNTEYVRENKKEKKDVKLFKKMITQIIVCLAIYSGFYLIVNNNYIFSEDFTNKAREILSQDINFMEIYSAISNKVTEIYNSLQAKPLEQQQEEQQNSENVQNNEENIQNNDENIGGAEEILTEQPTEETSEIEQQVQPEETPQEPTENLSQMEQDANYIKSTVSFIKPINGVISSEYGQRNPTTPTVPKNHTGTDIAASIGTKIVSATDGTVILASSEGDYGNHLKIQINDVIIVYAHCNKLYVKEGEVITQGQEIAEVGNTGNTTGPHLHFEVRYQDRYVNPQLILEL